MYSHFCYIHPQASIIIEEDGILPSCPKCGMITSNVDKHIDSTSCKRRAVQRRNELSQDKQAAANNVKFYVKGTEIEKVHNFTYLGRILMDNDDDTLAINDNLYKSRGQ